MNLLQDGGMGALYLVKQEMVEYLAFRGKTGRASFNHFIGRKRNIDRLAIGCGKDHAEARQKLFAVGKYLVEIGWVCPAEYQGGLAAAAIAAYFVSWKTVFFEDQVADAGFAQEHGCACGCRSAADNDHGRGVVVHVVG